MVSPVVSRALNLLFSFHFLHGSISAIPCISSPLSASHLQLTTAGDTLRKDRREGGKKGREGSKE